MERWTDVNVEMMVNLLVTVMMAFTIMLVAMVTMMITLMMVRRCLVVGLKLLQTRPGLYILFLATLPRKSDCR